MTDTHEIVKAAPVQIERSSQQMHPLVTLALNQSGLVDTQTLKELMQLQREWEANEARKSYTSAMTELKKVLPVSINKDSTVDYTGEKGRVHYTHASLGNAVEQIVPIIADYGFSHSWIPKTEGGKVYVTCVITHRDGHSEECTLDGPPDSKGGKNPVQAIASTITLLERYTFLGRLGIATADMKETVDREPEEKIDLNLNQRAIGSMVRLGETKESLEAFIGKPFTEWNADDLQDLRDLKAQKTADINKQPREPGQEG